MSLCENCKEECFEHSDICHAKAKNRDIGGIKWLLLALFFPNWGVPLYLVWRESKPNTARSIGHGLILFGAFYVLILLLGILSPVVALLFFN